MLAAGGSSAPAAEKAIQAWLTGTSDRNGGRSSHCRLRRAIALPRLPLAQNPRRREIIARLTHSKALASLADLSFSARNDAIGESSANTLGQGRMLGTFRRPIIAQLGNFRIVPSFCRCYSNRNRYLVAVINKSAVADSDSQCLRKSCRNKRKSLYWMRRKERQFA